MANTVQTLVRTIVAYAAHAAIASLALAIVLHLLHVEGLAEFFGDATFFLLAFAVATRREAREKDAR